MMSVIFATYYLRLELTMREGVGTSKDRTPKVEKDKNIESAIRTSNVKIIIF
jgi:hypothetical protein